MFSRSVPKSSTTCTNIYLANFVPLHKVNHVLVNIFSYLFNTTTWSINTGRCFGVHTARVSNKMCSFTSYNGFWRRLRQSQFLLSSFV